MITLIGDLGYDIRILESGTVCFPGGSGYHTAIGALAASNPPSLVASVGRDYDFSLLHNVGIQTDYIVRMPSSLTPRYIIDYRDLSIEQK